MTTHDERPGVQWVELWDGRSWPGRVRNGLPEFQFGQAPAGLSTRRQLRARGLCRGGQEPFARLTWKRDQRFAWLYVDAKAKQKRTPTAKQLDAVEKALAARKVCAECGPVEHYVRTTDQLCGDCHTAGVAPTAGGTDGWRTVHDWQTQSTTGRADTTKQVDTSDTDGAVQADDDGSDQPVVAAGRAAEALARTADRIAAAEAAQRDEELARWHADDDAQRATDQADASTDQQWTYDERGVA
ncbi:RRQRL motif-containing zinc-binding protein [Kribbella sp. NPDC051620]|uniref:RRQRL motif-containing zinc-binding protein n=1 Tax=Kribbella sp. NPDC051620 TaxID=3364120 RepID=UPI0037920782